MLLFFKNIFENIDLRQTVRCIQIFEKRCKMFFQSKNLKGVIMVLKMIELG